MPMPVKDLTNQRFGRLVVVNITPKRATGGHVVWLCQCDCGHLHEVTSSNLKSGNVTSCGCLPKELSRSRMKQRTGDRAPNWKGGEWTQSLSEYRSARQSPRYKEWRMSVFRRDKFKCQRCGNIGRKIRAHHILPFVTYKDKRYDIDNGITLCEDCHRKFHKIYGQRDCNNNMLTVFINRFVSTPISVTIRR